MTILHALHQNPLRKFGPGRKFGAGLPTPPKRERRKFGAGLPTPPKPPTAGLLFRRSDDPNPVHKKPASSGHFPIVAGWILLLAGMATAADTPIAIEQSGMQPTVQAGRPIPSWWDVTIRGSGLLEGRFEFQLKNDGELLTTLTTEEMALSGPQQRIRVLLPPANDQNTIDQLMVDIKFIGKKFKQDLGRHILRVAISRSRTFMVLTATSRLAPRRSAERDRIIRRLAFENLISGMEEFAQTIHVPLEPADLPQEPMGYCAFEMAILFEDEFRAMKKPQLEALAAWVRAGGSLYLEPTGILEQFHMDFLRNLTASTPDILIQANSEGRLVPGTIRNDDRLIPIRNSLGRVVLRVDDELVDAGDSAQWRAVAAFLCRIHADQAAIIRQQAVTTPADLRLQTFGVSSNPTYEMVQSLPASTDELLDWLKPTGVRMVPVWVLVLILSSFVVWIGPVDYFGLGRLRARKYTWITFPVATVLVTWLTVWITNTYMSSAEARRGLIIRDIGDDGTVVRTNRFELLFLASSRIATTEMHKGIFSSLATGSTFTDEPVYPQNYPARRPMRLNTHRVKESLTGRVPTEYSVSQSLAKWTPQLNRHFSLPGPADDASMDWQELVAEANVPSVFTDATSKQQMVTRIQQALGSKFLVLWVGSNGAFASQQSGDWSDLNFGQLRYQPSWEETGLANQLPQMVQQQPAAVRWLYQYSVAMPFGVFAYTSQLSPAGGARFDDLPIFDSHAPNQTLVIVVVPRGDDFVAYRKIIRSESE